MLNSAQRERREEGDGETQQVPSSGPHGDTSKGQQVTMGIQSPPEGGSTQGAGRSSPTLSLAKRALGRWEREVREMARNQGWAWALRPRAPRHGTSCLVPAPVPESPRTLHGDRSSVEVCEPECSLELMAWG